MLTEVETVIFTQLLMRRYLRTNEIVSGEVTTPRPLQTAEC